MNTEQQNGNPTDGMEEAPLSSPTSTDELTNSVLMDVAKIAAEFSVNLVRLSKGAKTRQGRRELKIKAEALLQFAAYLETLTETTESTDGGFPLAG